MSAQQGSRESTPREPSPTMSSGMSRFSVLFVVFLYLGLVLTVLLRSSERTPFSVLCVALATLAVGAVGAATWRFRGSASGRQSTLQARLTRVPDWLAYSVVFAGLAFTLLSFVLMFPRVGMGEAQQPALITGLTLVWLGYLCEPRPLVRRG